MSDKAANTFEQMREANMAKAKAEAQERANLNAEMERVMSESTPTPTQAENDAAKVGVLDPDEKEDHNAPVMPPLAEQQMRVANAGADNRAPYQTRQMAAPAPRPAAPAPAPKPAAKD